MYTPKQKKPEYEVLFLILCVPRVILSKGDSDSANPMGCLHISILYGFS